MRAGIAILGTLALAAACSGTEQPAPDQGVEDYAHELGTEAAADATPAPGGARKVAESNDVWDFVYSYPAAAGRIAPLRALLDARQAKSLDDLKQRAIDGRADADEDGYPFHAFFLQVEWKVVADLPDWLSLSAEVDTFEGGAHPNHGFDALLWDKRAAKQRDIASLFTSAAALEAAVKPRFCAALNRQREARRGEPVDPTVDDWMNQCPGIDETTIILGSSNNRTFDRIGFLIGPYVAGPYAEGSFEVTLPVSGAIKAAVRPEFADSFTVTR